jgi:hypothetical protein
LFQDFEAYSKSLPVRLIEGVGYAELYKLNYYVRDEDLNVMVNEIDKGTQGSRALVNYISAPSASGKTASVLPAFLKSKKSTHYLYLAFANNNGRNFEVNPSVITSCGNTAELQGAAFMIECVKKLLDHPNEEVYDTIKLQDPPIYDHIESYVDDLQKYLDEKLGKDAKVWFHVDEHQKICDRNINPSGGAAFLRGALELLAYIRMSRVIASYIEPLTAVSPQGSSHVCRRPIPLPAIDINQVIEKVAELNIHKSMMEDEDEDMQRLFTSVKVALGFKILDWGPSYVLHHRNIVNEVKTFLQQFSEAAQVYNSKESTKEEQRNALKKCKQLCNIKFSYDVPEELVD